MSGDGGGSDEHGGDDGGHGGEVHVIELAFTGLNASMFVLLLFIIFTTIARVVFHNPRFKAVPESALLIVLGIVFGAALLGIGQDQLLRFDDEAFFFVLIPPIIFEAGYFLEQGFFFNNLFTITLYAVLGTVFNAFAIGFSLYFVSQSGVIPTSLGAIESLAFGSLISAVDPVAVLAILDTLHVNEQLSILVFGESVLNDAVSIVLYKLFVALLDTPSITGDIVGLATAKFFVVAFGGVIVGVSAGLASAYFSRFTTHLPAIEPLVVFSLSLLSYVLAELFHLSGIMSILFAGIVMKAYTERNLSPPALTTVMFSLKMAAGLSESVIFMFLGLATATASHVWDGGFIAFTILFASLYRCVSVAVLTNISNRRRLQKVPFIDQIILMYGGLRGAIAFALAFILPDSLENKSVLITTTLAMVLFTVFVQGCTASKLIAFLHVKRKRAQHESQRSLGNVIYPKALLHLQGAMLAIVSGRTSFEELWLRVDRWLKRRLLVNFEDEAERDIKFTMDNVLHRAAFESQRDALFYQNIDLLRKDPRYALHVQHDDGGDAHGAGGVGGPDGSGAAPDENDGLCPKDIQDLNRQHAAFMPYEALGLAGGRTRSDSVASGGGGGAGDSMHLQYDALRPAPSGVVEVEGPADLAFGPQAALGDMTELIRRPRHHHSGHHHGHHGHHRHSHHSSHGSHGSLASVAAASGSGPPGGDAGLSLPVPLGEAGDHGGSAASMTSTSTAAGDAPTMSPVSEEMSGAGSPLSPRAATRSDRGFGEHKHHKHHRHGKEHHRKHGEHRHHRRSRRNSLGQTLGLNDGPASGGDVESPAPPSVVVSSSVSLDPRAPRAAHDDHHAADADAGGGGADAAADEQPAVDDAVRDPRSPQELRRALQQDDEEEERGK